MKDYYQIIGVKPEADASEIKTAYRKLAMENHPDRNPGNSAAEAKFKEINEAYETLKDANKRAQYDAQLAAFRNPRKFQQDGPFVYTRTFNGGMDIEEILRDIHRSRTGWAEPPRNKDVSLNYQISLEEAFTGKETSLTYSLPGKPTKTVTFKVPPGINDGTRLRFTGNGDDAISGIAPGDLYIRISIAPHPQFIRHGHHLATAIQIDYLDAILGAEVEVPTIEGSKIKLRVPAGIFPGQSLRASGKGMPTGTDSRGDLHVEVVISPSVLNEEQRQLIEQARQKRNT